MAHDAELNYTSKVRDRGLYMHELGVDENLYPTKFLSEALHRYGPTQPMDLSTTYHHTRRAHPIGSTQSTPCKHPCEYSEYHHSRRAPATAVRRSALFPAKVELVARSTWLDRAEWYDHHTAIETVLEAERGFIDLKLAHSVSSSPECRA